MKDNEFVEICITENGLHMWCRIINPLGDDYIQYKYLKDDGTNVGGVWEHPVTVINNLHHALEILNVNK
jgi:hypothetical protein